MNPDSDSFAIASRKAAALMSLDSASELIGAFRLGNSLSSLSSEPGVVARDGEGVLRWAYSRYALKLPGLDAK